MKKIMEFWKKLKYWQKGGIIGSLVYLTYLILVWGILQSCEGGLGCAGLIVLVVPLAIISYPFNSFIERFINILPDFLGILTSWILMLFLTIIQGFLIGALIGLIVGKLKKK